MGSATSKQSVSTYVQENGSRAPQTNKFEDMHDSLKSRREYMLSYGEDVYNKLIQEIKTKLETIIHDKKIKQVLKDGVCKYVDIVFHIDNHVSESVRGFKARDDACTIYEPLTIEVPYPEYNVIVFDRMIAKICDKMFSGFEITYHRSKKLHGRNQSFFVFGLTVTEDDKTTENNYECPLKNAETEKTRRQQNHEKHVTVTKAKSRVDYDSDEPISSRIAVDVDVEEKGKSPELDYEDKDEYYELYNKLAEQFNEANMEMYNSRFDEIVSTVQNDLLTRFSYQISYVIEGAFKMCYFQDKLNKDSRLDNYKDIIEISHRSRRDGSEYTSSFKTSSYVHELIFRYV